MRELVAAPARGRVGSRVWWGIANSKQRSPKKKTKKNRNRWFGPDRGQELYMVINSIADAKVNPETHHADAGPTATI